MTVMADKPDLGFAGLCAAQIEDNWHDPAYRNAIIMALGIYIENMIWDHRHEWQDLVNRSADATMGKARRAVVKAYLATAIEEVSKDGISVKPYTRRDGTHVGGYKYDREWQTRNKGNRGGFAPRTITMDSGGIPLDRAAELGRAVNAYRTDAENNRFQSVHYTIEDHDGNERNVTARNGRLPKLKHNERVTSFKPMGLDEPITLGGDTFNLVQALGASPKAAGHIGSITQAIQDNAQVEGGHFARVHDASQTLLKLAGGDMAPPAAQAAAAMGLYVGKHGPEVARVLGPHARRMTYKYRGMIATPSQQSQIAKDGKQPGETKEAYEHRLAYALASDSDEHGGIKAIPDETTNNILLATGSTAPSHGFILDKNGKVTQQAVGVADDHYVPFNLAQIHTLHGGSFVRSRVYGGPTTEDLSLALRSGAKRATIISRHGAYTIELEHNADGVRNRYGDVPVTVVNRYGRLLDAVRNSETSGLTDPETGAALKLNGRGYEVAMQALKTQYPLLIKDVKYFPPSEIPSLAGHKETAGIAGKEDTGYVRPYYLKPSEAVNGYYDELLGYDPEWGAQNYDEDERYRTGKANMLRAGHDERLEALAEADRARLAKEEADRQAARRVASYGSQRPSPSPPPGGARTNIPVNLTQAERAVAEAGGGQRQEPNQMLDLEDTQALLRYIKTSLQFLNNSHDFELRPIKDAYADHIKGSAEGDQWLAGLRSDPQERADILKVLDAHLRALPGTGLAPVQIPTFTSGGEAPAAAREAEQADPGFVPNDPEEPTEAWHKGTQPGMHPAVAKQNAMQYDLYRRYRGMLSRENTKDLGEKGRKALADDQELFGTPLSANDPDSPALRDAMEDPSLASALTDDDTDGLPYWKHYENKLHRAAAVDRGENMTRYKPLHRPSALSGEPKEDPGGEDYAERMMREFRDQDYT